MLGMSYLHCRCALDPVTGCEKECQHYAPARLLQIDSLAGLTSIGCLSWSCDDTVRTIG
jgi:hypothetical protein